MDRIAKGQMAASSRNYVATYVAKRKEKLIKLCINLLNAGQLGGESAIALVGSLRELDLLEVHVSSDIKLGLKDLEATRSHTQEEVVQ